MTESARDAAAVAFATPDPPESEPSAEPGARASEPAAPPIGPASVRSATGADMAVPWAEHHFVVGAKGSYAAAIGEEGAHHLGGGGVFFEVALLPEWLELEYGVEVMTDGHRVAFPMDLLLKLPFHASEQVRPFIGLGATVVPGFEEASMIHAGPIAVLGSYFWLSSWGGLVVEGSYALVLEDEPVHEVSPSAGLAYRW